VRICAITNVYNEAFNLPTWLKYYGSQVGLENCIVVDHGSDDGSTSNLGRVGVINMPREKFNDGIRAQFISNLATSMLRLYDAVLYSDCDEILVPDPGKYSSLLDFCARMTTPAATAIGLNVVHRLDLEGPIRVDAPILQQRRHVRFVSPMCKTLIVRKAVSWGGGFHSCSHPPAFSDLYLFHLRWLDLGESLKRLAITRQVQFADERAGPHHRWEYARYVSHYQEMTQIPVSDEWDFTRYAERFVAENALNNDANLYATRADIRSNVLIRIPERFSNAI
jgi:Glycosyl transferase family 2